MYTQQLQDSLAEIARLAQVRREESRLLDETILLFINYLSVNEWNSKP